MVPTGGVVAICLFFFFQAEDGIRYLVRSRGLGDVYKRQELALSGAAAPAAQWLCGCRVGSFGQQPQGAVLHACLLYTSDAADERSSVDLGGRRIIKKKTNVKLRQAAYTQKHIETEPHHKHREQNST